MELLEKLSTSNLFNLLYVGLIFIIRLIFPKFTDIILDATINKFILFIKDYFKRKRLKKVVDDNLDYIKTDLNIIALDHTNDGYNLNDIKIKNSSKKLFLSCPKEIEEKILAIDKDFNFNKDSYLDYEALNDLKVKGIDDLPELIEIHRRKVANNFLELLEKNLHSIFNQKKFGVYSLKLKRRNQHEDAGFDIEFFETDFFTHKVFRSIYKEVISRDPSFDISKYNINELRPFLTSFGVNAFITANTNNNEEGIIFTKRAAGTSNTPKDIWHVTMNEGLSHTDLECGKISILSCLNRGLDEELAINENIKRESKFLDLFLVKDTCEIGITAVVEIDKPFSHIKNLHAIAKDSTLESRNLTIIPLSSSALKEFIKENECTSAALFTLNMIASRKNVFL